MIEKKMTRVDNPADPTRCQAVYAHGQCPYKAMEGSKFCQMHGGQQGAENHAKKIQRQYNLAMWQARVEGFTDHSDVKTLRDEVGILRLLMENVITQCKSQTDLLLYSSKISELVGKIERTVVSCNRLEASTGMLLDKSAALHLAAQMVDIISEHVTDAVAIDAISMRIAEVILGLNATEIK